MGRGSQSIARNTCRVTARAGRPRRRAGSCGAFASRASWGERARASYLAEKVAVSVDVRGQVQCVLAGQPLGQLGIALLQCFDDLQMVDDGARGPVALGDGRPPYGSHVKQQIAGRINDRLRAAERGSLRYETRCWRPNTRRDARSAVSSGTHRTGAAAWQSRASGACSVASRAAIDSSAAHIWIISMIWRFDLRMM